MDPVFNPYSPGAGRPPAALIGRDAQLQGWQVALDRIERGRTAQPVALYGLRGVGKTVLLSEFARCATERSWIVAQVEAGAGKSLREALGEALHGPLADLARPSAGKRLLRSLKTALSFKASYDIGGTWNFGLDLSDVGGGGADTGLLETDLLKLLHDVAAAAAEEDTGLAILIDEAQDLGNDELAALCAVAHTAGQNAWRCIFALAGLPSLPRVLAEAKSYSERLFTFQPIEHLGDPQAARVLTEPAADENVSWDPIAVEHIVRDAAGYPYFLQQFGQDTWNEAPDPHMITLTDARVGAARGRAALDAGFFRARWDRATRSEQHYMRAMAADGDHGSGSGEVAIRLGRKVTSLGPTRANLIAKGLVYAPEHGIVAFTVPGMADFITRQPKPWITAERPTPNPAASVSVSDPRPTAGRIAHLGPRRAAPCGKIVCMPTFVKSVTFDCRDAVVAATFWATVLGSNVDEDPTPEKAYLEAPGWGGPNMWFVRVPEPKTAKNRLHFDLRAPGPIEDELRLLIALGATVRREGDNLVVMEDPDGNEFCVE